MKHVYRFDVSNRSEVQVEVRRLGLSGRVRADEAQCVERVLSALAEDMPKKTAGGFAPNGDYTTVDMHFDGGKCWVLLKTKDDAECEFAVEADDNPVRIAVAVGRACGTIISKKR